MRRILFAKYESCSKPRRNKYRTCANGRHKASSSSANPSFPDSIPLHMLTVTKIAYRNNPVLVGTLPVLQSSHVLQWWPLQVTYLPIRERIVRAELEISAASTLDNRSRRTVELVLCGQARFRVCARWFEASVSSTHHSGDDVYHRVHAT